MAGDWIKIEHTTPDKPEVIRMAAILRLDRDAVAGKLFRLWAWADQNSVDGADVMVTADFIDDLARKRGFTGALMQVGWLHELNGALLFPNFERHNGESAKSRAMTNRRISKHRKCNAPTVTNVTLPPLQKPLPEKRREENIDLATHSARGSDWPDLKEVTAHGAIVMASPECCEKFWNEMEACGWVNKHGQPVSDWRPLLRNYNTAWKANEARNKGVSRPSVNVPPPAKPRSF